MKVRLRLLLAIAIATAGCGEEAEPPAEVCDESNPNLRRWFTDADGDGVGEEAVPSCALARPEGLVALGGDCAPGDGARFRLWTGFADSDGDGVGDGPPQEVCGGTQLPSSIVAEAGDCAPEDSSRFRIAAIRSLDADRDGVFVPAEDTCVGRALPEGASLAPVAGRPDCNDADPDVFQTYRGFTDRDGDGYGAGEEREVCAGSRRPVGLAERGDDCDDAAASRFVLRPYTHRDADRDGATVPEDGDVCSGEDLPQGYLTAPGPPDCDDTDRRRAALQPAYRDLDEDGFGAGPLLMECLTRPYDRGYSEVDTDCDDQDPARFREAAYAFRDRDGDGYVVEEAGTICTNQILPAGYAEILVRGLDCDDTNPSIFVDRIGYPDADGDGAPETPGQRFCTGGSLPSGFFGTATDCAPADPTAWQVLAHRGRDQDGDGFTVTARGALCTGRALPAPFTAVEEGFDCDDRDPTRFALTLLFDDLDRDGVGAGAGRQQCLGIQLPAGTSPYGDDPNDLDPSVSADRVVEELVLFGIF